MSSSFVSGTLIFSTLMIIAGSTATYATSSYAESVALLSCAGSFVCLASMGVNLAILFLTLSTRSEIYKLREALDAKEFKIELSCGVEEAKEESKEDLIETEAVKEAEAKDVEEEDDEEEDNDEDEEEEEEEDTKANLVD